MASKKHDDAKKKRDSAKRKRDAALAVIRTGKNKDGSTASGAQIAAARQRESTHASTMRLHGDIMRAETGREKGQRTTYTGPIGVEARTERGLPAETDWQKVNLRWLQDIQAANPNWTITQARNELKRMFADDRPGYLAEQQRRMDAGEKVEFPEGDVVTSVDGPVRGSGVGGPGLLGPFSPGGRMPAGYGGYGGYPVLSLGTPSGLSYPAAAEAAEGYAGALGFNIGPEGGLVYRPWEARAWQQTGIDPNLWNAPFAGGGLLGGGYPGYGVPPGWTPTLGGPIPPGAGTTGPMPTGTGTEPEAGGPVRIPGEPAGWVPPRDFTPNPVLTAAGIGPFHQWTREQHRLNQLRNQEAAAEVDQFAANPFTGPTRNWQAPAPVIPQITVPAPAQGGAPSVDDFSSYATQVQSPPVARTVTGNVPTVTPPFVPESRGPDIPVGMFMNPLTQMLEPIATAPGVGFKGSYAGMPAGLLGPR